MAARIRFSNPEAQAAYNRGGAAGANAFFRASANPATSTPSVGAVPSYLGGGNVMQPQPAPGQMEAIAAQLGAGYPGMDHLGWLKSIYQQQAAPAPMAAPTAASGPTPAQPMSQGISPTQLQNMFGSPWGQRMGTSMSRGNR